MPKVRTPTVKDWFDKSEACESRVVKDFQIGRGEEKVFTNLILVDDKLGIKRAFICNFDIAPCLAFKLYEFYSRRWGIEICYRTLENDFRARTTTKNPHIRMFYFFFSCCLFNLWILVNICIGLLIYGRIPKKPIITAKMFAIILYRIKEEYFDNEG
jgi:IS4 transposase